MSNPCSNSSSGSNPTPEFKLRKAESSDFEFTRDMYIASMEPLLTALNAWDLDKADAAFRSYFDVREIEIVLVKNIEIGWIQISKTNADLFIDQIHLIEDARGKGIGTWLIKRAINDAAAQGLNVNLSFVKGNSALRLYEKLGFGVVAEDETKFHMRLLTNE